MILDISETYCIASIIIFIFAVCIIRNDLSYAIDEVGAAVAADKLPPLGLPGWESTGVVGTSATSAPVSMSAAAAASGDVIAMAKLPTSDPG